MTRNILPSALIVAAIAAAALAGCERAAVSEKVEGAIDRTRETLSEAGDKLKPKLEAAGEKLSDAAEQVSITVKTGERSSIETSASGASRPAGDPPAPPPDPTPRR
ncbi:MAG TPA: hypothetical protein VLC53_08270 [Myxococcota bacterium]|nr:hypothetical protein [Myxococcota bacterium]